MRVLLLNQYFPPDMSATAQVADLVVQKLAERNQVVVIAGRPSYAPKERHPYYFLRHEKANGVTIDRVGSTSFHRGRMAGRLANSLSYMFMAFFRAVTVRRKPDIVIAMSDPPLVCAVAALVSLVRGCRFAYNIQDLHPDMAIASGMVRPGYFVRLWDRIHGWAMNRAELIVVLGDDMRARVMAKGVAPERISIVRDGASAREWSESGDNPVIREIRGTHDFVVVHAGNLGHAGSWSVLVEAAAILKSSGCGFVFVGDGAKRRALEEQSDGLDNVRFLPFYSQEAVPQVMLSADLHVVAVKRGLEGLVVPSKLYPILMAGRPVLAAPPLESDVAQIVLEYKCGFVADPDDPKDVAAAVSRARADPRLLAVMAERAREAGLAFSQQHELKRFVRLVESIAAIQ